MPWLSSDIKAELGNVRAEFRQTPVSIVDVTISTGAGMYRRARTQVSYPRSGALALGGLSRRDERHPGGYLESGKATLELSASSTGASGPTNESLLMRTGAQTNAIKVAAAGKWWRPTSVGKEPETGSLVVDMEQID